MVHILASHLRSELLACPQLVRFDMVQGMDGPEATLLIKASSLGLKYLLRREKFRLILTLIGARIAYAIEIPDDHERPGTIWSFLDLPAEKAALLALTKSPRCAVFLFNELAVNVAWAEVNLAVEQSFVVAISDASSDPLPDENVRITERLEEISTNASVTNTQITVVAEVVWCEIRSSYVTQRGGGSHLSLFAENEGEQQEELAVWLVDQLHFPGCVRSPQVHEKRVRELTDVLLSYENGSFLVESKSLSVLARADLPGRAKLERDLIKHVGKAARQLAGGIRNLKNGLRVTDAAGIDVIIEREIPAHAIILVPDLSLLHSAIEFGREFVLKFANDTGGYLHILDPAELLRVVQVADIVSRQSNTVTPMMGFDWYLIERAKKALEHETPDFAVLFRLLKESESRDGILTE